MQFSVPQFVEIEDKIIGPLTLKQFLILLGGGLLEFLYYSIFKTNFLFFLLSLPTVALFAYLAFGRLNGRPVLSSFGAVMKFVSSPKIFVFERTGDKNIVLIQKKTRMEETIVKREPGKVASQLKRLAYLLDQKTAEEERLIHSGEIEKKWLNQI